VSDIAAWVLPVGAGICLSAACGFRTFVPLLCIALASHYGVMSLDAQYAWLATTTGMIALGSAAVLEVAGYYVPLVDHALDVIATPLAMFTAIGGHHGVPGWLLALVLGGGMSGAVQLTTVKARLLSTGVTAGFGNPLVATAELMGATALSAVALLWPVMAVVAAVVLLFVLGRVIRTVGTKRVRGTY
jgi:hypothetical protein